MGKSLLTNATANGDGAEVTNRGGQATFILSGTFDGATVTLNMKSTTSDTYVALPNGAFNAATAKVIEGLEPGTIIKATVSSAGASTNLDARLEF